MSPTTSQDTGTSMASIAALWAARSFFLNTEKARASVVPETFWYFSCVGGFLLLAYAVYRADPVFIIGQATGLVIYARNIYFIWSNRRAPRPASIV